MVLYFINIFSLVIASVRETVVLYADYVTGQLADFFY